VSEADREFAKDMEVGDLFKDKNYKGAELRFREALARQSDQPDATFKLAESLNKLGKNDEANERYQAYLKIQPNAAYNERA
jgi:Tfp pilus assembly protein PilF